MGEGVDQGFPLCEKGGAVSTSLGRFQGNERLILNNIRVYMPIVILREC
jgi:hypothetical protein